MCVGLIQFQFIHLSQSILSSENILLLQLAFYYMEEHADDTIRWQHFPSMKAALYDPSLYLNLFMCLGLTYKPS